MDRNAIKKTRNSSHQRFSDQEKYYLNYLETQLKAVKNRYSILGRHHKNLNNFIVNEVQKLPKGSKVLDAGCGLSTWVSLALRNKYKISGVDGEPDSINLCKKLYKGQDYRVGNLYELDYKDNTFDAVVMREVIEHFKTPEIAVKETARILKPGGAFIITTPNYNSLLLHIIEHTYNRFFGGECKPYKDDVHPSKFRPQTLDKVLKKYFKVKKIETIDYGISLTALAKKK